MECSWQWKTDSSPLKETWCDLTIYCSKQNKLTKKTKTTDAPRKTHSAWSNKNSVLKGDLIFADEEGVPRGHPQDLTLVLLGYFLWWCMGIPKLELLSILHLISSFSNPYTWKLPSYKTKHNSISNISVSITYNQPFLLQVSTQNHHIYSIYYCSNFPESSIIKRTQKESDREANTNSGKNLSKQNSSQRSIF
jgi:hypothetical protein